MAAMQGRAKNWVFKADGVTAAQVQDLRDHAQHQDIVVLMFSVDDDYSLTGFLHLKDRKRATQVATMLDDPNLDLTVAVGTLKENLEAIERLDDPETFGEAPHPKDRVTGRGNLDLREIRARMVEGWTEVDLVQAFGADYIHNKIKLLDSISAEKHQASTENMKDQILAGGLRKWQIEAHKLLKAQSEREILFVTDTVGNTGKTHLARYLVAAEDAFYTNTTRYADVLFAYRNELIVCVDVARAECRKLNYELLETFKNGIGFSRKYRSQTRMWAPAKVIVLMNENPDLTKLSEDRYLVKTPQELEDLAEERRMERENRRILRRRQRQREITPPTQSDEASEAE